MHLIIVAAILALLFLSIIPGLLQSPEYPLESAIVESHESDAEYLEQVPNDISPETAIKVRRALAYALGCGLDEIWIDTPLEDIIQQ